MSMTASTYGKALAVFLFLYGIFLAVGGVGGAIISDEGGPTVIAMLGGVAMAGVLCIVAAFGVYRMRVFGFAVCTGLALAVAAFAVYVSESIGQGLLWPTAVFLLANGLIGLKLTRKTSS
jgi:hypothetical protein